MRMETPDLYQLYRSGKRRGGSGWFFIIAGVAANVAGAGLVYNTSETNAAAGWVISFVGDAFILIGIPTAVGGKVRRVKARNAYQQYLRYGETKTIEPYFKLNVHGNGVGLAYVF